MSEVCKRGYWPAALAMVLLSTVRASAASARVDFEDVDGNRNDTISETVSRGFKFTSLHFHAIDDADGVFAIAHQPGSSVYIGHEGASLGRPITMMAVDGSPFSVIGIDAARVWDPNNARFPNASHLELLATFNSGSSSALLIPLPAEGVWQTFPLALYNLTSLRMDGVGPIGGRNYAFGVDNILAVPEPASVFAAPLACVGCCALAGRRSRRDSQRLQ
jgi:hypothetical protein